MCGIAGKLSTTAPVDRELLDRMCAVVTHRGPDSRGIFLDDGVGLGIQRLRVIDLETGDQPVYNEDRSVVVVLNGEIYNYRELRAELERRGHRFATHGDTEVIVHLYEDEGAECVQALRGMFAFALWDRRRHVLLLARDRVGKKPLFYADDGASLWFGSEAKSILEDPSVDRAVDYDAIDSYLQLQYVPHPLSAFQSIRKLPPAHTLVWQDGRAEVSRYWKLSYRPAALADERDAHELIREQLLEATRLRLRSDVPLGAFLSGGVDSSAVVAAMAMEAPGRVRTFSIGFDEATHDETDYAREIAERFDTEHHELRVRPDAIEILPQLVWHYGEPFADSSAIPSFYLAQLTREHVTVALNGDGGDENFAGYRKYVSQQAAERLAALPRPARRALRSLTAPLSGDGRGDSVSARLKRITEASLLTGADRYATSVAVLTEAERERLYTADFLASLQQRTAPLVKRVPYADSDAEDEINRSLDVDVQTYLPGALLVKMDIASMAHSLEVRSPLLDHRFMELAASLPGSWKLSGRTTKHVFKDALRAWLPDHILDRPKSGFGVPLRRWFRADLRRLPEEILLDPRSTARGLFRTEAIRELIEAHRRGTADHANQIWALIQLELWFQTFVDQKDVRPLGLGLSAAS